MVNKEIKKKAKYLASQPYTIEVLEDETTSGGRIYLARNPELEGCMAQGATIQEAIDNLTDARIEFIESLLEDGEPIPKVMPLAFSTSGETEAVAEIDETISVDMNADFLKDLFGTIQPKTREPVMKIQPILSD